MNKYTASLTAESFLYDETTVLATLLLQGLDVETISERNLSENLISCKKPAALKRLNSILVDRLYVMNDRLLDPFLNNDIYNSRIILLYIICKTDKLVRDFILNIYGDKIITRNDKITRSDMEKFFVKICEDEQKLLEASDSSKAKIKTVLMRLLVSAGVAEKITNEEFRIIKPVMTEFTKRSILDDGGGDFLRALGEVL